MEYKLTERAITKVLVEVSKFYKKDMISSIDIDVTKEERKSHPELEGKVNVHLIPTSPFTDIKSGEWYLEIESEGVVEHEIVTKDLLGTLRSLSTPNVQPTVEDW